MSVLDGLNEDMSRTDLAEEIQALRADVRSAAAENIGLRARVAELEIAGADMDDVLSAMMIENACRDLSLRDRTTLARGSWARAVRGGR